MPPTRATLTGLLLLGVPELAILAAVAILGKAGFDALVGGVKRRLGAFFKEHGPAQQVSPTRYRIGLVMFLGGCNSQSGPGPEIHDTKYIALDANGIQLEAGQAGPCVLDQFIGLVWEAKIDTTGLFIAEQRPFRLQ